MRLRQYPLVLKGGEKCTLRREEKQRCQKSGVFSPEMPRRIKILGPDFHINGLGTMLPLEDKQVHNWLE
jgi:hypothetical protein